MTAHRWANKNLNTPAEKARKKRYNSREHKEAGIRLTALVASGLAVCWRCGRPIPAGSVRGPDWHVGHNDDGTAIMGPEHTRSCNLRAAASKGARTTNARRQGQPVALGPALCSHCKQPYQRRVPRQRFCSDPCREAMAYTARAPGAPRVKLEPLRAAVPPMTPTPCTICGIPTLRGKSCSPNCAVERNARDNRDRYRTRQGLPVDDRPTKRWSPRANWT